MYLFSALSSDASIKQMLAVLMLGQELMILGKVIPIIGNLLPRNVLQHLFIELRLRVPNKDHIICYLFHQLQEFKVIINKYKVQKMACSKYEYVKKFQEQNSSLPQTYILVRIDGRGFTKFCAAHDFAKPNDLRAIQLMNAAAEHVCNTFTEIFLAYGQSDQYSFVFNKHTTLFSRRTDKILTCVVSAFTGAYVANWERYMERKMVEIPSFDGRIVCYPNEQCLKDYFRWRQVDCHINNLYNTAFWKMVETGKAHQKVEQELKLTNSAGKNEILFDRFGINYNNLEIIYRRGTFLLYEIVKIEELEKEKEEKTEAKEEKQEIKEEEQYEKKEKKEQQPKKKKKKQEKEEKEVNEQAKEESTSISQPPSKKQKPKGKYQKKQKLRRKLVQSHQDCIKDQFWSTLLQ